MEAAAILDEISRDWRELLAGSEGFLTSPQRRGLFRRRVIWGEQDSMVCIPPCLAADEQVLSSFGQAG